MGLKGGFNTQHTTNNYLFSHHHESNHFTLILSTMNPVFALCILYCLVQMTFAHVSGRISAVQTQISRNNEFELILQNRGGNFTSSLCKFPIVSSASKLKSFRNALTRFFWKSKALTRKTASNTRTAQNIGFSRLIKVSLVFSPCFMEA